MNNDSEILWTAGPVVIALCMAFFIWRQQDRILALELQLEEARTKLRLLCRLEGSMRARGIPIDYERREL